jgi:hypothetical protein
VARDPLSGKTLEQVLADRRGAAAVLRANGHPHDADLIEAVCDEVAGAAHEYVTRLSEAEAMLRSGRSRVWLRSRFPEWEAQGNAWRGARGERIYRMLVVPRHANVEAAFQAGRRSA